MNNRHESPPNRRHKRSHTQKYSDFIDEGTQMQDAFTRQQQLSLMPELNISLQRIKNEVMNQVNLYRQMSQSRQPQKCLQHNNPLTLYCKQDSRPLCTYCVYQTSYHRYHTVMPLLKAASKIQHSTEIYTARTEKALKYVQNIIELTSLNIQKADDIFPKVFDELESVYFRLQNSLAECKKQNRIFLQAQWEKTRIFNQRLGKQMMRVEAQVKQAVRSMSRGQGEDYMLFRYNMASNLANLESIITSSKVPMVDESLLERTKSFDQLKYTLSSVFSYNGQLNYIQSYPNKLDEAQKTTSDKNGHEKVNSELKPKHLRSINDYSPPKETRNKNRHSVERLKFKQELEKNQIELSRHLVKTSRQKMHEKGKSGLRRPINTARDRVN